MKKFFKFLFFAVLIAGAIFIIKKHFFDLCEEEDWDVPEEPEELEEEDEDEE